MMNSRLAIAILVAACLLIIAPAQSQQLKVNLQGDLSTGSGFFDKWDSLQDSVLLYRTIANPSAAAVRMVSVTGKEVSVFPLRDIPDARRMSVWDTAATPDGGLIVSVIAEYGPHDVRPIPIKRLLLTYDSSGVLRQVWDTAPYHHILVAVDKQGNVFGFGEGDPSNKSEPLLVKYSPTGKVLGQFLPANSLVLGHGIVVKGSSSDGESAMFISGDELNLWLASTHELLRFSTDGRMLGHHQLAPPITKLADALDMLKVKVIQPSTSKGGDFIAAVALWPKQKDRKVTFSLMRISSGASEATLLGVPTEKPSPGRFVGMTSDGKMVFLQVQDRTGIYTVY